MLRRSVLPLVRLRYTPRTVVPVLYRYSTAVARDDLVDILKSLKEARSPVTENKIIYTETDEAPALATYSLLPIVQAFVKASGVTVESRDISLAGRILALFPDRLTEAQRHPDALAELGALSVTPDPNIIKLPNISASLPQMFACIKELQDKGYAIPDYPENPQTDKEKEIKAAYDKVKGSAVNPVLREGNSDRRAAAAVKQYAMRHPHRVGAWTADSKSHVSHMEADDFYGNEQSTVVPASGTVSIKFIAEDGEEKLMKKVPVLPEEIIDGTFISAKALRKFYEEQIEDAKAKDVLFSLHLKATMMKVSDPIMFGHCVEAFYADVFAKHAATFEAIGVDSSSGIGDVYKKIKQLPQAEQAAIEADIQAVYVTRPELAMVNSAKGITNLHVPSDVIIDASMPAAIRDSGRMWDTQDQLRDAKFTIPDRCYAGVFQAVIEDCKANGALDPSKIGSVANVGLMAQKAEEYGSHDKTFKMEKAGTVQVVTNAWHRSGEVLMEHKVEAGDIWRMCQVKDAPIQDWVKLAVNRARATGATTIFWLDPKRAHDRQVSFKVQKYLQQHDTEGLDIRIMSPVEATKTSLQRMRAGQDTISVTGNVLRDYLTDLFPILELGTSAKMLSIVPLMAGGGLFETGAGGSAPKHVQQFEKEGHLRWDSLGEFLALAESLDHLARAFDNQKAAVFARALHVANGEFLSTKKAQVSRKVNELDNRGSHFYLAMFWAKALAEQNEDAEIKVEFGPIAQQLIENEDTIVGELNQAQGKPMDVGGYFKPDFEKASIAMRPSATLNGILASLLVGR